MVGGSGGGDDGGSGGGGVVKTWVAYIYNSPPDSPAA